MKERDGVGGFKGVSLLSYRGEREREREKEKEIEKQRMREKKRVRER